jgi:hypothetical protein
LSSLWSRRADAESASETERGDVALRRLAVAGALILLLVPLALSAAVLLIRVGSSFHALGDNAQNELHVRDVGHHLVLLGPYSRDGWNHPGPAMYYLLALPYRLTGSNSVGMLVGALVINAAAVTGMAIIAWRRAGLGVLLFTVLGLALVMHALGADFLRDPWNPYVTVLPFGLLIFLVWELSAGSAWALPVTAGLATFLVQTHIGYVPIAIPLAIGGVAWFWHSQKAVPGLTRRSVVRWSIVAAIVLGLMWLPPLLGVVLGTPGNLSTALHYFLHPKGAHSLLDGYRVMAQQLSTRPEWIVSGRAAAAFTGESVFLHQTAVPWLVVPFVLGAWLLWRNRVAEGVRLAAIVAVAFGLGMVAVSRTIGPVYVYRLRWSWLLGTLAMVVVTWAAWTGATRILGAQRNRIVLAPVACGVVVLMCLNTISAVRATTPDKSQSSILARLVPPVLRVVPQGSGPVVVTGASFGGLIYAAGVRLWLARDGIDVRVPNEVGAAASAAGDGRVYRGGPMRSFITVADGPELDALAKDAAQRLLSYRGTVALSERAAIEAQLAALDAQYRAGTLLVKDLLIRSAGLSRRLGTGVGVFIRTR